MVTRGFCIFETTQWLRQMSIIAHTVITVQNELWSLIQNISDMMRLQMV